MTPSAKADGFLGNGALPVGSHRPHPGLVESASQDVPGRVLVSVQGQAAVRADVLPNGEVLSVLFAARAASLRSSPRIHSHHRDTGSFSLVSQDRQEAAPCGVRDCPAEPVVPDHSANVQAFHRDQAVATDQIQSSLVMMFTPLVGDVGMKNTNDLCGFPSIRAALLLATDGALGSTQRGKFLLEKTRVLNDLAVRSGQEVFESHVNADGRQDTRLNVHVAEVAGQNDEPLVSLALERCRLDDALNRPVDLAANHADMLHAKSVVVQTDAVSVGRERDAVEAVLGFESRVARCLTSLHSAEERDERFVETTHRGLCRGEVEAREVGVVVAQVLELGGLIDIPHCVLVLSVEVASLLQTEIVESPVRFEHDAEFALLVGVRKEPEFECPSHSLLPLLAFDVAPDTRFGDSTAGTGVVTAAPKGRQARAQRRELRAQIVGGASLEAGSQLRNTQGRVGFDEEMHVVGHDFKRVDRYAELCSDLMQQNGQALFDVSDQDGPTVLRAPHEVVLECEDRATILSVLAHAVHYTHANGLVNNKERRAAIPLSAKADSTLAA